MKIIKCLGTAVIVLLICILLSNTGHDDETVPIQRPYTVEIPKIEPYVYTYYDVPLTKEQQREIQIIALENNVPYEIVLGVMYTESNFRADAIGDSGASEGIMQIQPYWHSGRMEQLGVTDLTDLVQNATVGIDILAEKLEKYGNVEKALVVYNMGDSGAKGICSTKYSQKVLRYADELIGVD